MPRPIGVDVSGMFRGSGGGLRRRWADVAGLGASAARVRAANWPGTPPGGEGSATAGAVVVGHLDVSGALRVWAPVTPRALRCVDEPGLAPETGELLAVLGPEWVEAEVERAIAGGRRVVVACAREGAEPIDPPPGGAWLEDPWAGDPARGVLGNAVLAAAAEGGMDAHAARAGAVEMLEHCSRSIAENPAWTLARALRTVAAERGVAQVVFAAGSGALDGLVRWAAGAATYVLAAPSPTVPARPLPVVVRAGDPAWNAAIQRATDTIVVLFVVGNEAAPWAETLAVSGGTVLRVRLPSVDPSSLGGAVMLWLSALAVLATLEDRPLPA